MGSLEAIDPKWEIRDPVADAGSVSFITLYKPIWRLDWIAISLIGAPMRLLAFTPVVLIVFSSGCSVGPPARPTSHPSSATTAVSVIDYHEHGQVREAGRGNGRNGGLPPGIAKNLARGKPLPPGIAKQYLPDHVLHRLPPLEAGYEYVVVAGKILLIEIATQVIHDILVDVLLD